MKIMFDVNLTDGQIYESRCRKTALEIYVPSDERFGDSKESQFIGHRFKSMAQSLKHRFKVKVRKYPREFYSFQDVLTLYESRRPFRELKFPRPQVIQGIEFLAQFFLIYL